MRRIYKNRREGVELGRRQRKWLRRRLGVCRDTGDPVVVFAVFAQEEMKKAGFLAASIAAVASSAAFAFGHDRHAAADPSFSSDEGSRVSGKEAGSRRGRGEEKFAPRFDGLRFIETLITAHR